MTKALYHDNVLLIHLARWHTRCNLPAALGWLWSDGFVPDYAAFARQYPPDSAEDRRAVLICECFDTVGALYQHGLLNGELIFDWLAVAAVWDRIKGYVLGRRHEVGGKPLWTHFEAIAIAHKRAMGEYST